MFITMTVKINDSFWLNDANFNDTQIKTKWQQWTAVNEAIPNCEDIKIVHRLVRKMASTFFSAASRLKQVENSRSKHFQRNQMSSTNTFPQWWEGVYTSSLAIIRKKSKPPLILGYRRVVLCINHMGYCALSEAFWKKNSGEWQPLSCGAVDNTRILTYMWLTYVQKSGSYGQTSISEFTWGLKIRVLLTAFREEKSWSK